LDTQKAVDRPPEDTLFALDAIGLKEGASNRIVLAGKAANHHVDVRDGSLSSVEFVENSGNILVNHRTLAKAAFVAAGGKLPLV
jgi:hypothetical protein